MPLSNQYSAAGVVREKHDVYTVKLVRGPLPSPEKAQQKEAKEKAKTAKAVRKEEARMAEARRKEEEVRAVELKQKEEAARARAEAEAREEAKREEERVEREAQEKQKCEEEQAARARAEAEEREEVLRVAEANRKEEEVKVDEEERQEAERAAEQRASTPEAERDPEAQNAHTAKGPKSKLDFGDINQPDWEAGVVPFTITLDADFASIRGNQEVYKTEFITDIALASNIPQVFFKFAGLEAGSIINEMVVAPGNPAGVSPDSIIQDLIEQLNDPNSRLKQGKWTSKSMSIVPGAKQTRDEGEEGETREGKEEMLANDNQGKGKPGMGQLNANFQKRKLQEQKKQELAKKEAQQDQRQRLFFYVFFFLLACVVVWAMIPSSPSTSMNSKLEPDAEHASGPHLQRAGVPARGRHIGGGKPEAVTSKSGGGKPEAVTSKSGSVLGKSRFGRLYSIMRGFLCFLLRGHSSWCD